MHKHMPLIVAGMASVCLLLLFFLFLNTTHMTITGNFITSDIMKTQGTLFGLIAMLLLSISVAALTCYFKGCKI